MPAHDELPLLHLHAVERLHSPALLLTCSKVMAPGKSHAKTMVGTPYYMAPELIEDKPYSKKADLWAAGCVLYELATLQRPFRGSSVSAIAVKVRLGWGQCLAVCTLYPHCTTPKPAQPQASLPCFHACCLHHLQILRGTYAPLPEQYSPELHALVAALLRRKPEQRPSIDEASLGQGGTDSRIRAMQLRASLPVN